MGFDHFNLIAPLYERFIKPRRPEILIGLMNLHQDHLLLDAGGGTGRIAQYFTDLSATVIVADQAFQMLLEARKKDSLQPVCMTSESLAFNPNTFDRVIMVDAFHHVRDQGQTARQLLDILKPGGRLVIEEPNIHLFWVKMIALFEKLTFMRSHFLDGKRIAALLNDPNSSISIKEEDTSVWVIVDKETPLS